MKRFLMIPLITLLMWTPGALANEQVNSEIDDEYILSAIGEICIVCKRENWDPKLRYYRADAHIDLTDLAAQKLAENGPNGEGWGGTNPTCKHLRYTPGSDREKDCQAAEKVTIYYLGPREE